MFHLLGFLNHIGEGALLSAPLEVGLVVPAFLVDERGRVGDVAFLPQPGVAFESAHTLHDLPVRRLVILRVAQQSQVLLPRRFLLNLLRILGPELLPTLHHVGALLPRRRGGLFLILFLYRFFLDRVSIGYAKMSVMIEKKW